MKTCSRCDTEKNVSEFYKDKRNKDGFEGHCKLCRLEMSKKWRIENPDKHAAFQKAYHETFIEKKKAWRDKNRDHLLAADAAYYKRERESVMARAKNWRERHPLSVDAHKLTTRAIKSGELIPQPCEVCGKLKVDAHHDDYSKPLSVRWLCRLHHKEHHARELKIARLNGENTEKI